MHRLAAKHRQAKAAEGRRAKAGPFLTFQMLKCRCAPEPTCTTAHNAQNLPEDISLGCVTLQGCCLRVQIQIRKASDMVQGSSLNWDYGKSLKESERATGPARS